MQAKRYRYIDSLKGISCLMVMFCHYICVLKYATEMTVLDVSIIQRFAQSNFGILIDEDFWLQLFFVASGFLLVQAKIESIADLINKSCNRFLRFYLPILSACCIIYTMGKTMGFPISDTKALFACKWFQQYYPREFVWKDLIIDPIKTVLYAGSLFNGPYWVISMMFYSSLLIYLLSYLFRKQKKQAYLFLSVLAFAFAAGFLISKVIFGCLIGAATGILAKHCLEITNQFKRKKARIVFCVLIVVVAFLPLGLHRFLTERLDVAFLQYQNNTYGVVYWALIVFLISRLDNFNLNKSREYIYIYITGRVNRVSFGIYSFHWPVFCSLGTWIMLHNWSVKGFIFAVVASVLCTLLLSALYNRFIENNITKILKKFKVIDILIKKQEKQ